MRFRNQAAADAYSAKNSPNAPRPRRKPAALPGIAKKAGIKDRKSFDAAVSTMPDRSQQKLGAKAAQEAGKADMVGTRQAAPGWQNPRPRNPGVVTTQGPNDMGNGLPGGKGPSKMPPGLQGYAPPSRGPQSGGIYAGDGPGRISNQVGKPFPNQLIDQVDHAMPMPTVGGGGQGQPPPPGQNPWGPGAEGINAGGPGSLPPGGPMGGGADQSVGSAPSPMGLADAVGMSRRTDANPDFGKVPGAKPFLGPHPNNPQALPPGWQGRPGAGAAGGAGGGGAQPFQGSGGPLPPPQGAARAQMGQALRRRMAPQPTPMTNPGGWDPGVM